MMMPSLPFFDVLFLLLAAVVLVPMLHRIGFPSVLGYLAAGIALGPHTPGPVVDAEHTKPLAEFGVVFLLFAIGLEMPLSRLKIMRSTIMGLGLPQILVTAVVLGAIGLAAGLTPAMAVIVGMTLAMSSTATVLALLVERNETVDHHGRLSVAVLIFQDLAIVPILTLLPMLAKSQHDLLPALGMAGLKAAIAIIAIFALGRLVLRPAYAFVASSRNPDVFVAANLLLVLAIAWMAEEAGMSMALGAFLGGLMLADSSYRHQIESDIQPFRGLLLGLFFMTVGLSINLPFVADHAGRIIGVTVAVMTLKAAIILGLCRVTAVGRQSAVQVALLLAQAGEFAFVVFERAMGLGLLSQEAGQTLLSVAALSMVLTPALAELGRRLARRHAAQDGADLAPSGVDDLQDHVIIAGYGRMGRAIARLMRGHGVPFVALDLDADRVITAHGKGLPVFYGDAGNAGVLRSVGMSNAKALVVTVGIPKITETTIAGARQVAPTVPVIVRAKDKDHEDLLYRAGASAVVPETVEASLQMAAQALRVSGIEDAAVQRSLNAYRKQRYGAAKVGPPPPPSPS